MNKLPTLSGTDLDAITGGRTANPPGGSILPGIAGEAKHKKTFSDRVQEWQEANRIFPYKP